MPMARSFAAGILIIVFIGLIYLSVDFMKNANAYGLQEGFDSQYKAPTRATDCQCLPGYIPSNTRSQFGGRFVLVDSGWGINFLPDGTKNAHWVKSCNMCNINICDPKNYTNMTAGEFTRNYTLKYDKIFDCSLIPAPQPAGTFFCKHLEDPSKTRKCY